MSMSRAQRREEVIYQSDKLNIVKASAKNDRRFRLYVAQHGDQILREWWPCTDEHLREAMAFIDGYRMALQVWAPERLKQ